MKNKLIYRILLIAFINLCWAIHLTAQDETDVPDTVIRVPSDQDETSYDDEESYQDSLVSIYRSIPFDTIRSINSDKGFYYKTYMDSLLRATHLKTKQPKRRETNSFDIFNSLFGIFFWIAAIALFVFIIYKLFLSNSSFFSRSKKNLSSDIAMDEQTLSDDPQTLLQQAIRNGNFRLAVRYLYLDTLQLMSDRKYIQINVNKTNYEYVNEVGKRDFANEFASLTLKYEYVWYGEYPVDQQLFNQLQESFIHFNKIISR